jgi:hypothetical protein
MRILITNNTLQHRAGSELYVRDVAGRLRELGHEVAAFSTRLGAVADELAEAGVTVVDGLERLPFQPDIIHGQHHFETMTALLSLPGVPAVYFCHGALPWEEMPPVFPRIRRYAAVDFACRERVVREAGVSATAVRVLFNFVDLQRFARRPSLPEKPRRALVFSNNATEGNYAKVIRKACARSGLSVEVAGMLSQNVSAQPEKLLMQYDLVFAKGRAALEAMAVGNAVVVCDTQGCGLMVSPENFDALRPLNFGFRTMQQPITVDILAGQIAQYDVAKAAAVCRRVRAEADLRPTVDQIVRLYEEVVTGHKSSPVDAAAELRAAGKYLQWLSPVVKQVPKHLSSSGPKNRYEPLARKAEKIARWLRKP